MFVEVEIKTIIIKTLTLKLLISINVKQHETFGIWQCLAGKPTFLRVVFQSINKQHLRRDAALLIQHGGVCVGVSKQISEI